MQLPSRHPGFYKSLGLCSFNAQSAGTSDVGPSNVLGLAVVCKKAHIEEQRLKCLIKTCYRQLDLRKLFRAAPGDLLAFASCCCLHCALVPLQLFRHLRSLGGTRCVPEGSGWVVFNHPTISWSQPDALSSTSGFLELLQSPWNVLPPTTS